MSWLFKSNTPKHKKQMSDKGFYAEEKVVLPPNFAEDLLNLELDVEQPNVSIEIITRLLELYRIGVEYYSSIKSDKYMVFKNKCQSLLLKPNVSSVLNQENKNSEKAENNQFNTSLQRQKEIQNTLSYLQQLDGNEQIQKFLQTEKSNQQQISNIIENDIKSQEDRLNQRMMKRLKDPSRQSAFFMSKSQSSGQVDYLKRKIQMGQRSAEQLDQFEIPSKQKSSGSDLLGIEEEDKEITPDIANIKKDHFTFERIDSQTKQLRQFCKTETDDPDDALDTEKMKMLFQKSSKREKDPDLEELIQYPYLKNEEKLGDLEINGNGSEFQQEFISENNIQDGLSQNVQPPSSQQETEFSVDISKNQPDEQKNQIEQQQEQQIPTPQTNDLITDNFQSNDQQKMNEDEKNFVLKKIEMFLEEQEKNTKLKQEASINEQNQKEKILKSNNEPTSIFRSKTLQSLFQGLSFASKPSESQNSFNPSPEVKKREKKIRDMVSNNKILAQQKQELLKNQILPF